MRIAYLASNRTGNGYYRAIGPMTALEERGGHTVRRLLDDQRHAPLDAVRDVDVLHIHRYADERAQLLAREAKAHAAAVVWDNDDDMGAIPKGTRAYRFHGGVKWEQRVRGMRRIFGVADLVTAPSRTLADRLHGLGAPRAAVIENHVPDAFARAERRPHAGVTIGWVAGVEHQLDVDRLRIPDVLQRLLDERPDVGVTAIGLGLGLRGDRYRHMPQVHLLDLPGEIAAFDVAIAPLADHPFNHARSNVKLKEYAAVGVPWLASPVGPYAGMGERQGGRLVADDRWHEELVRLIDAPRDRRKLGKRARRWGAGQTISKNAAAWEARFAQAVAHARAGA